MTIAWSSDINPFGLLNFSRNCWKFFWRSKDQSDIRIGLGALLKIRSGDSNSFDKLRGLRLYGGLAFPGEKVEDKWEGFAADSFVLPQVEWNLSEDACEFNLRLEIPGRDLPSNLSEQAAEVYRDFSLASLAEPYPLPSRVSEQINVPGKLGWNEMVAKTVNDISQSRYSKLVLSRYKKLLFSQGLDLGGLVEALSDIDEDSYLFAFAEPNGKAFVGRSPERLLSWNDEKVFVDAIAGTRKRLQSKSEDLETAVELQNSRKDLNEHRYVSDFVFNTLSKHCSKVERLEREQLFQLRHVQHMRSTFTASLNLDSHGMSLLHALHPTPAVGGVPAEKASAFIDHYEPFQRGLFAGALGVTDGVSGDFAIGIRTALLDRDSLTIFAGAGIVEQSDPEAEWQETEMKMKNFLDLFRNGVDSHEPSYKH